VADRDPVRPSWAPRPCGDFTQTIPEYHKDERKAAAVQSLHVVRLVVMGINATAAPPPGTAALGDAAKG
jgi:hypothetical protein